MDFSFRSEKTSGNNEPERVNPQQHVFAATPLNYVPYVGPPMEQNNNAPTSNKCETETAGNVGPAILFLPQHSTQEEWNNILATTKSGVALTGSAAMRQVGPIVGLVDIGESEDSYLFRVSLPGVAREEKDFNCNIDPEGKISINGVTTTGEQVVCKDSQVFQMQTRNLCLPGRFSISFQLPGPVDNQHFTRNFGTNGILEGMVKKRSKKTRGPNEPVPEIPQQHFLKVAPLNPVGVPYIGPPSDQSNTPSTPHGGVALTGSAAMRQARPILGLVDIGESEDSYLFRASLPGVAVERDFGCDIVPDGRIFIHGLTTRGEQIVCEDSEVFQMQTRNLCQPGPFTISFQLPGPVNTQIDPIKNMGPNGLMECIVKKM